MIKTSTSNKSIVVIAHNIRSSHNIGSLFRTCEGLGVDLLILSGYTPYPVAKSDKRLPHESIKVAKAISKTALGSENSLSWSKTDNIGNKIKELNSDGYEIIALEQTKTSVLITDYKPTSKTALIIGNEITGIDKSVIKLTNKIIEIPMLGKKESFNVVQATAMALFYIRFT